MTCQDHRQPLATPDRYIFPYWPCLGLDEPVLGGSAMDRYRCRDVAQECETPPPPRA